MNTVFGSFGQIPSTRRENVLVKMVLGLCLVILSAVQAGAMVFSKNDLTLSLTVRNERMQLLPVDRSDCRFHRDRITARVSAAGYQEAEVTVPIEPRKTAYQADVILYDQRKPIHVFDLDFQPLESAYLDVSQPGVSPLEYALDLFIPLDTMKEPAKGRFLVTNSLWWSYPLLRTEFLTIEGFHRIRLVLSRESFNSIQALWVIVPITAKSGNSLEQWLPTGPVNVQRLARERQAFNRLHEFPTSFEWRNRP